MEDGPLEEAFGLAHVGGGDLVATVRARESLGEANEGLELADGYFVGRTGTAAAAGAAARLLGAKGDVRRGHQGSGLGGEDGLG